MAHVGVWDFRLISATIATLLTRLRALMPAPVVLSVGSDRTLLNLRDEVLRAAGYAVREHVPSELSEVGNGGFDVVVLCHSIRREEMRRIIRRIRHANPNIPILLVRADGEAEMVDASVHGLDGPQVLLDSVSKLLEKAS